MKINKGVIIFIHVVATATQSKPNKKCRYTFFFFFLMGRNQGFVVNMKIFKFIQSVDVWGTTSKPILRINFYSR